MMAEKEFAPKLNKYCSVCDHLAGCPLEQEARQKAKVDEESYLKEIELSREIAAVPDSEKMKDPE